MENQNKSATFLQCGNIKYSAGKKHFSYYRYRKLFVSKRRKFKTKNKKWDSRSPVLAWTTQQSQYISSNAKGLDCGYGKAKIVSNLFVFAHQRRSFNVLNSVINKPKELSSFALNAYIKHTRVVKGGWHQPYWFFCDEWSWSLSWWIGIQL